MASSSVLSALGHLARNRGGDEAFADTAGRALAYGGLQTAVATLAQAYRDLPETVGLLAPNGIPWAVAHLALLAAGKTIVPLPEFFSPAQLTHIVADARIGHVLTTSATARLALGLGLPVSEISLPGPGEAPRANHLGEGRLVIYTSGSTGRPRGVRIGEAQLAHSAEALRRAIGAASGDRYLSVLPLSLLLEQVCAIHVPLRSGAPAVFAASPLGAGTSGGLAALVARIRPTHMVLVPQLLAVWVEALTATGTTAPDSLRFVATGGAPVPESLAAAAWARGIPVYEGYGLSECCSVVALNRPGARVAGTVGRPLDALQVTLEEGEIVVRGPTVMDGYLNEAGAGPGGVWRTGDLGALDAEGRLIVYGRRDSMLVTPGGRNVVPEWIEASVTADPRLLHCILIGRDQPCLTAILVPHPAHLAAFQAMSEAELETHVAGLLAAAPAYARPARCRVVPEVVLRRRGLLTGNGRPRRGLIEQAFAPPSGRAGRHVVLAGA